VPWTVNTGVVYGRFCFCSVPFVPFVPFVLFVLFMLFVLFVLFMLFMLFILLSFSDGLSVTPLGNILTVATLEKGGLARNSLSSSRSCTVSLVGV
jgi:hypothetical protein